MSVISATPSRAGTLSPPYTSTNGSAITRADFQRWAHEDRNHAQADATRQEREKRLRFKQEQKELMRSRGAAIKDAQKAQMQTAASMVHEHREENAQLGSTLRTDEDRLRKRRTDQQKKWADHGYELTQQYTIKAAQNNMRSLKAQNAGVVNGMHAKRQEHQQVPGGAAASERRGAQGLWRRWMWRMQRMRRMRRMRWWHAPRVRLRARAFTCTLRARERARGRGSAPPRVRLGAHARGSAPRPTAQRAHAARTPTICPPPKPPLTHSSARAHHRS